MKYCNKCRVSVSTCDDFCPLCASTLIESRNREMASEQNETDFIGESSCDIYPKADVKIKYNFTVRLFLFLSIVATSSCLLINILVYHGTLWSLIVIGGIAFFWATLMYPFLTRKNIGHYIAVDAVCTCLFFIVVQFVTKTKGWSLDYVIPFLLIAATTLISVIILIRRMKWHEYALYQFITIILGILPIISVATGLVIIGWPSIVSVFYSVITLIGMFIFADKKYKNELIKRFHF